MALKLNTAETYEPLIIKLTSSETPIAYNNKIAELVEQGAYKTKEDAEKDNPVFEIECELYYEKDYGLFAVEQGAVETGCVYSPYNGTLCEETKE